VNQLVAKEVRALLLPWFACMALLGAGALVQSRIVEPFFVLVVIGGACSLGALSLGHEYLADTVASMLAQPIGRVRVLAVKTVVLVAMLVPLFTLFSVVDQSGRVGRGDPTAGVVAVAVLSGLCLAPWFTILTRSPLAGAFFGIATLGMIWVLLGFFTPPHFSAWAFWRIAAVLGLTAVALTWRGFIRLEAIDGRGPHVHMAWNEATAVRRVRNANVAFVRKELGLQQLTYAIAAIYFGSSRFMGHDGMGRDVFVGVTVLYSAVLALLIGSIASAEERQLGTLEWHQLLPMPAWKQWVLKAGSALGLSLLFGVGLPAVLMRNSSFAVPLSGGYVAGVVLLTVIALYVSSLSSSSIRALLVSSIVSLFVTIGFSAAAQRAPSQALYSTPINLALLIAFLVLVLGLAFDNHGSVERSPRRISFQLFILGGWAALELVVAGVLVIR